MKPRDRIASHLRRILVAAGMALPQPGHADTSTPSPGKPDKPDKGKKDGDKKPKPRERLGYEVVDMMPEPYVEPKGNGTLELRSNPPGAVILIDGKDIGKKTPLASWKLPIGFHAVTLKLNGQVSNFVVDIKTDQMHVETRDLRPSPAPETKK
jgi:hypothetical protein